MQGAQALDALYPNPPIAHLQATCDLGYVISCQEPCCCQSVPRALKLWWCVASQLHAAAPALTLIPGNLVKHPPSSHESAAMQARLSLVAPRRNARRRRARRAAPRRPRPRGRARGRQGSRRPHAPRPARRPPRGPRAAASRPRREGLQGLQTPTPALPRGSGWHPGRRQRRARRSRRRAAPRRRPRRGLLMARRQGRLGEPPSRLAR